MENIILLPQPRQTVLLDGSYVLQPEAFILLDVDQPNTVQFAAVRFQQALQTQTALTWQRTASPAAAKGRAGLILRIASDAAPCAEGYTLRISEDGIALTGSDPAGVFYGICTLIQLINQAGRALPCLEICDWPDFSARGVMLDVSRNKVPQLSTVYDLVDRLAGWKINQLQLYTEHTFAYLDHAEVWREASPFTGEEILDLDEYCRQRFIELVPNQNTFGHMEHWLRHPRYQPLAEKMGDIMAPWGKVTGPYGLAPANPESIQLVRGLFDELLPHFSSRMLNVGCDETFDLGQGQSQEMVARAGVGRVYLDFLKQIYTDVTRRGFKMQFWGDIIVQHPDLVPELPQDAVGLLWGYEDIHPFDQEGAQFAKAGIAFYVCPGTSSWNSLSGRTANAVANLRNAAINGLKFGASGMLITDWGDNGHWQMLPVSYLGFAVGAAFAWCFSANEQIDISQAVGRFAFDDRSGMMGKVAYDLGNIYTGTGIIIHNSTVFFRLLQQPLDQIVELPEANLQLLERAMQEISTAIQPLSQERMSRPDADLIRREYLFTARLMRHACYRAYLALEKDPAKMTQISQQMTTDIKEIIDEFQLLWLSRNRPGGLTTSLARFEAMKDEYTSKFLSRFLETPESQGKD